VIGTLFSASRAAIANICAIIGVFMVSLSKRKYLKTMAVFTLISVILVMFSFVVIFSLNLWPESVRYHILSTPKELTTLNMRVNLFWKPALEAVKKKPFFGWGYGKKIYRDERPFANGEKPSWELRGGLHNTFITILFHQGIFGLLSYLLLLLSTAFILFKMSRKERDERKLLALTFLSIIVGSFFVNSFLLSVPFKRIAPILGMASSLFKQRSKYEND
jgi:O-antigen ligase